jgi:cation/acetate symporter
MNGSETGLGHPSPFAMGFFAVFVVISLGITFAAARRTRSTHDYFAAGGRITAWQNALALIGDFVAASGFLGGAGYVSLFGVDGVAFSIYSVIGFSILMFLFAEPLRNLGKYTFTDVIAHRTGSSGIRVVSAATAVSVVLMFLLMQMIGSASLLHLLFGMQYEVSVLVIGAIMLVYVLLGGMIAATWIQIVKAVLMLGAVVVMLGLGLYHFHGDPLAAFRAAAAMNGDAVLGPRQMMGEPVQALSIALSMFGLASLPHVLMRFYTVRDVRVARRSMLITVVILGCFQCCALLLGMFAMVLVGGDAIRAVDRGGNMAIPLLAERLGGEFFLAFVAAIAFATILAVVSGLVVAGSAALSHDVWTSAIRRGKPSPREQMVVARLATVVLCAAAVVLGILFKGQNIGWLTTLGSGLAASAIFPTLILAIYWPKLTAAGAAAGMITGLAANIVLIYLSPLVQQDVLQHADAVINLKNPAIICVPLSFLVTYLVSIATFGKETTSWYAEVQRQMVIGRGRA